ncbi:MAG: glycosyltransferase family 4 protein [Elusimicrobia bacterium]|nr:glycosyltransferase family 4 protein [Elusimicrobiota bacterium]
MPIKVLHVITKLELGGAQQNTLYTLAHLDKNLFKTGLICGQGGVLDKEAPLAETLFLKELIREINPVKDFLTLLKLYKIFKDEKPDIIHTHSSKAGILGRIAGFFARVPVIIHTFHGFGFHEKQNFIKRNLFVLLEKICAKLSNALIFVSKANIETAEKHKIGRQGIYRLIRSGIQLEKYGSFMTDRVHKRRELGITDNGKLIITVGNLKAQKNPSDFINAAFQIARKKPEACFLFAGGGETLEKLKQKAHQSGISENCIFTGWRKDIPELLSASDIFMLTSLWEGLPRSLVEALKTGLPCVCYETDGVKDLVKDGVNGFLIPMGNVAEMVRKIELLLIDESLRAKLAGGARETNLSDFDINYMVRLQQKLYMELHQERGRRG